MDSFRLLKFDLNSITVYRNAYPVVRTQLRTENYNKLYPNSLEMLAVGEHVHGIPYNDYANHLILVFDLTRTQQASHDCLYLELMIGSISMSLRF